MISGGGCNPGGACCMEFVMYARVVQASVPLHCNALHVTDLAGSNKTSGLVLQTFIVPNESTFP